MNAAIQIKYGSLSQEYLIVTLIHSLICWCLFGFRKQKTPGSDPVLGRGKGVRISVISTGQNPKEMM